MKIGYIRIDRGGPPPDDQRRALEAAGVTDFSDIGPVYVDELRTKKLKEGEDPLPSRTAAIGALRVGDVLVVANAGRLGLTRADVLMALAAIGRRRASVFDAAEGREFVCSPDIMDAVEFADLAVKKQAAERTTKARKAIKMFGSKVGPYIKPRKAELDVLKAMWVNPEVRMADIVTAAGVKERTLYRMFGPRGTPFFGTTPQKKRPRK